MYIDKRSSDLLKLFIENNELSELMISNELSITKKQISYAIDKLNDSLISKGIPKVEKRYGVYFFDKASISMLIGKTDEIFDIYYFSQEERVYIIVIYILFNDEFLSSYHFIDELNISKSTFLGDQKEVKKILNEYDLQMSYDRKEGYKITGNEYNIRLVSINAIKHLLRIQAGDKIVKKYLKITDEKMKSVLEIIKLIEHKFKLHYTDEKLLELPYFIIICIERINKGKIIDLLPQEFVHISGTREFIALKEVFSDIQYKNEILFLTSIVKTINVTFNQYFHNEEFNDVVNKVIDKFTSECFITIENREWLYKALLQHFVPAYYRIKFGYHIDNEITPDIGEYYEYLHMIVKKSVEPFEELIGSEIPENELSYFTVLFAGFLRREGYKEIEENRKIAIVVCTNGISVSNFLLLSLMKLFPELRFDTTLSQREFYDYNKEYDIVFTTVPLKCYKPVYILKPFSDELTKQKFREKVLNDFYGVKTHIIDTSTVVDIIEKYASIKEKNKLFEQLNNYFHPVENEMYLNIKKSKLAKLFTEKTVKVSHDKLFWKDAISLCANPLIQNNSIEKRYVEKIISDIEKNQPFLLIADGFMVSHAGINDGVNKVSMSLLKLPRKISIDGYMEADFILTIATPNYEDHLEYLKELNESLSQNNFINRLRKCNTDKELLYSLLNENL